MGHVRATAACVLLAIAAAYLATAGGLSAQQVDAEPLARIEQIIVNGRKKDSPTSAEVKLIRGTTLVPPIPSLSLFADDEVITGVNVGMTIIILDAAAEQDNTVHIGAASQFRIRGKRSIFLVLGKILADVRGLFDVVTSRATLGAKSTEFEVRVTENDTQLLVLEGAVGVTEDSGGRGAGGVAPLLQAVLTPFRMLSRPSFINGTAPGWRLARMPQAVPPRQVQHQRWLVEVNASAPVKTKQQLTIANRCQQPHLYDVEGPETLPWFNIFASERVEVKGGTSRDVVVELQIDPSNIVADTYTGNAIIKCLDCFAEPGCTQSRDLLPVQIKLARSAELTVRSLEEITIGNAEVPVAPWKAPENRVRTTVNWTNDVILAGQPSYSARRVVPHYDSPEERARVFREARFAAVWRREAGSFERLGEIYTDWGEGAKAVEAYTQESAVQPDRTRSSDFLTDLAEANRLKGRVDEAEQQLRTALQADPGNGSALNALGNVYMDRAEIAIDANDARAGEGLLERARSSYERSFEGASPGDRRRDAQAVARANVGETHVESGNLARQNKRFDVAQEQYAKADNEFKAARTTSPGYAFSRTGWGDAFQGMGLVAQQRGDAAAAREAFSRADVQYKAGLQDHPDLPEGHIGVGDLLLREGRQKEALDSYLRAATARPDEPAAYYRLGTLLEKQSPVLAARYLSTYLQLQPTAFKTGRTARRATLIVDAARATPANVSVPNLISLDDRVAREALTRSNLNAGTVSVRSANARQGSVIDQTPKPGAQVPPGSAVDFVIARAGGADTPPTGPMPVPDVVSMSAADAARVIAAAGFKVGRIERKKSTRPRDTVIKQDPKARDRERPGTAIDLEVAESDVKPVKVPDVVGDSRDHAIKDIREDKLQVGDIREQPGCEPGRVLAQDPPKDTRVPPGTAVSLTVAVPGPQAVTVPRLGGLAQPRAEATVRERGLRIGKVNRTETDQQAPGTVIGQEPKPNALLAPGCPIDLEVAVPIPLVTVPNFVGLTEEQARQRLPRGLVGAFSALRLGDVTYRDYPADVSNRMMSSGQPPITVPTVVEQNPAANSQVRKGTDIDLVILRPSGGRGSAPQGVAVPKLQGLTLEEARKTLAGTNLVLGDVRYNASIQVLTRRVTNRIISHDPPQGTVVPHGTRVAVVIDGYPPAPVIRPPEFEDVRPDLRTPGSSGHRSGR